ncbi:hypothetical protein GCM10010349_48920 [Streptomyces flavofungini]|nr:hypothetical protein GCM10010349_48920 [Streptomyces flavofungini]
MLEGNRQLITAWLAGADAQPGAVHAAWAERGVALLPLGRRFDAVRVPAARIHAAVHSSEARTVAAFLGDWLAGPVIRDIRSGLGPYYVLIAPDSAWGGTEERLSTDTFLGVPRLGHPVSMLTRWVVPPTAPGDLCDPAHLSALLMTAETLKAVDP